VKFHSPSTVLGAALALVAALFLTSCGGGGAAGNPDVSGVLTMQPSAGTVYAGIPFTFQVQGGRPPYTINSSEQSLLAVPSRIDGHSFTVVANNPGVIDVGLQPGALPVRSVLISIRSGDGQTFTSVSGASGIQVAQNFLTGYGISFSPITCPIAAPPANTQVCAGGQSAVQMSATFNGSLAGNRQFTFQVLKGHFQFVFPQTGVVGNSVTTISDHSGNVLVVLQANAGVGTEIGVLRVIDTATGVYDDHAFIIQGAGGTGTLTLVPDSVTFTGNLTTDCGSGQASILAFDGTPPYTAIATIPQINLANTTSSTQPGVFNFTLNAGAPPCPVGSIAISDSAGAHAAATVTSAAGAGKAPTPPTFQVAPNTITLACGSSGSVSAVGGTGSYSTTSSTPNITATVSGNTVTITRLNSGTNPTPDSTVNVTDGANIGSVTVTSPVTCP